MKRNLIFTFIFVLGFSLTASAQLGKLKVKTPKVKNPITKKSTSGGEVAKEAATMKRIENETADLIVQLEAIFASKEATNQRSNKEIEDALYKVKSKISTLTNYYKMSRRIDEFQGKYDKYKAMADAEMELRNNVDDIRYSLESQNKYALKAKTDFNASNFATDRGAFPNYSKFESNKATYLAGGKPEAEMDTYISNIETYFNTTLPANAAEVKNYVINTANASAFDEMKWKKAPKSGISRIESQLNDMEGMYARVKDAAWVDALKADLNKQKTMLETYISSGDYDRYVAAEKKKVVDARRMDKPFKKDASMEAIVKKYHSTEQYGTLKRIVITSDWIVVKNEFGIPLEKKMVSQVATTKDGVCDKRSGRLFKTYEGAGTYGKIQLSHYGSPYEINCDNINK